MYRELSSVARKPPRAFTSAEGLRGIACVEDVVLCGIAEFHISAGEGASGRHTGHAVRIVAAHAKKIHDQGTGVLGMKLIGEGSFTRPEDREAALSFVMGLGAVDAVTIGYKSPAEIDEAIERMNRVLKA